LATGSQQRRLDRQIVLIGKIRRLLPANDPGHIGCIINVANISSSD
jgi:hypothetical protein